MTLHKFCTRVVRFCKKYRWRLIAVAILILGMMVRLIGIDKYSAGLNQDEASIGYEAWSLMQNGTDRNGNAWPVHFVAWGSGQNALYAYLTIPFLAVFGRSTLAIRLPMALAGCVTLVVWYFLCRKAFGEKKAVVFLLVLAVMPWHILKSRWGLESNIFPDMIIWSVALIYYGVTGEGGRWALPVASVILGLATYAYGTAYLFIPLFLVAVLGYLVWKKYLYWKKALVCIVITAIVALPMMIFVIINFFGWESVHLGPFTIPSLAYNRFTEVSSAGGGIAVNAIRNWATTAKIIMTQDDGLILNSVQGYGILYGFSLPLVVIGGIFAAKDHSVLLKIMLATLLVSFMLCGFVEPNINRINVLWLVMAFFAGYGVVKLSAKGRVFGWVMIGCYMVGFLGFLHAYLTTYQAEIIESNATFLGVEQTAKKAATIEYKELYVTEKINQPYIYYLWWTGYDAKEYLERRKLAEEEVMFQEIQQIGDVYFREPKTLKRGNAYIVRNDSELLGQADDYKVETWGNYSIIY